MPPASPALSDLEPEHLPLGLSHQRAVISEDGTEALGCDLVSVRGHTPGPVLLVVGAIHGDEYEGPTAIPRFIADLDPAQFRGTVIGLPVVNEPAFFNATRGNPADGQNLARVFPGRPNGTPTEQIAHAVTMLMARCDAFCDLHAAGTYYELHAWAGYAMVTDEAVLAQQRRLATAFGLDFVWGTPMGPGRSLAAAAALGVPAVYVEQRGAGQCRPADVARNVAGLKGLAIALGQLDGDLPTDPPRWWRESREESEGHLQVDHPAPRRGLFTPAVSLWDEVTAGQPLGWVASPGGGEREVVTASRAGRVAMLRIAPPVDAGDYLAVVVPV